MLFIFLALAEAVAIIRISAKLSDTRFQLRMAEQIGKQATEDFAAASKNVRVLESELTAIKRRQFARQKDDWKWGLN